MWMAKAQTHAGGSSRQSLRTFGHSLFHHRGGDSQPDPNLHCHAVDEEIVKKIVNGERDDHAEQSGREAAR